MNEMTITLTEEQMDIINYALTVLAERDQKMALEAGRDLETETDDFWKDLLTTRAREHRNRSMKCMYLQKTIESRKARATA